MILISDFVGPFIVITVMGALYAIIYMIAQALENQKLLAVAKAEMQEVLIGGFMVILLSYIVFNVSQQVGFYTIKSFVPNYGDYVGSSAPSNDDLFLFNKAMALQNRVIGGYTSVFINSSKLAGEAATASIAYISRGISASQEFGGATSAESVESGKPESAGSTTGTASGSLTTYLCKPVAIIASLVNEIASFVSRTITIMFAQNMLLTAAKLLYAPFFMLGIILRSFNIVRGIGAFFIGFSIALFVYPIFLILMEGYTIEYFKNNMLLDIVGGAEALNGKINDLGHFARYSEVNPLERRIDTYCDEYPKADLKGDVDEYQQQLDDGVELISGNNVGTMGSLMFAILLSQGFALTMVVSLTGGIAKVMGSDISPFIIGNITRIGAM